MATGKVRLISITLKKKKHYKQQKPRGLLEVK